MNETVWRVCSERRNNIQCSEYDTMPWSGDSKGNTTINFLKLVVVNMTNTAFTVPQYRYAVHYI